MTKEEIKDLCEQEQPPATPANKRQVAGDHYRKYGSLQHWDIVAHFGLDYFQGQITKYVMRWKEKGGIQDLEKAAHFLEKYIEVAKAEEEAGVRQALKSMEGDPLLAEMTRKMTEATERKLLEEPTTSASGQSLVPDELEDEL